MSATGFPPIPLKHLLSWTLLSLTSLLSLIEDLFKDEWVLPFELVPIIEETVCSQMKIKSQNEKEKLAKARKQTYLKGFTKGTMIVGEFSGKKVQEAKPLIRTKLLEIGKVLFTVNQRSR